MSKMDRLLESAETICLLLAAIFFLLWLVLTAIGLIINL